MADQNTILMLLATAKGPLTIVELVKRAPKGGATAKAHRLSVLQMASHLVERRFATAFTGEHGRDYDGAAWLVTDAGRRFHREGKKITSGQGNLNVSRKPADGSLRERLWRALRIKPRATIPQLLAMIRTDMDADDLTRNAQTYMQRLCWAGVVLALKNRQPGLVSGSNGHKLFMLAKDLGPDAPVAHREYLFDPNTKARLPYTERNAA